MTALEGAHFRDSRGETYHIAPLTSSLAHERAADLLFAHNLIPSQKWGIDELLADRDQLRPFLGKWDISRIAIAQNGDTVGFCIGFELPPDHTFYHEPCFYLHRLAVVSTYQGRGVGAVLQAETVVGCFIRGFAYVASPLTPVVLYGQTDAADHNRTVRVFYETAGFRVIGQKPYDDRTDFIMKMDAQSFWHSRHVGLWRRQRLSAQLAK